MKKVLKIVLILAVILLALDIAAFHYIKSVMPSGNGNNDIVEGYYKKFHSNAPLEMKYSQLGAYDTAYTEFSSADESIGKVRVWYPRELENGAKTWPMIIVVNASCTPASSYEPFFPSPCQLGVYRGWQRGRPDRKRENSLPYLGFHAGSAFRQCAFR